MVPENRIRKLNDSVIKPNGRFVLYWMIANRRAHSNFSLDRAIELANDSECPLLVVEPIRLNYKWACHRFHRFMADGMHDQQHAFRKMGVSYFPFVETEKGQASGIIESLSEHSTAVVTDDHPGFFNQALLRRVTRFCQVHFEAVDSVGILPMRTAPKVFLHARFFRTFLQKVLRDCLADFPSATNDGPANQSEIDLTGIKERWKPTDLTSVNRLLHDLKMDQAIAPR